MQLKGELAIPRFIRLINFIDRSINFQITKHNDTYIEPIRTKDCTSFYRIIHYGFKPLSPND